ncbi:MAG: hypothetical protein ABGZ53_11490 [Fuerstiella sp.]
MWLLLPATALRLEASTTAGYHVAHRSAELTSRTREQILIVALYRAARTGGTYESNIPYPASLYAIMRPSENGH